MWDIHPMLGKKCVAYDTQQPGGFRLSSSAKPYPVHTMKAQKRKLKLDSGKLLSVATLSPYHVYDVNSPELVNAAMHEARNLTFGQDMRQLMTDSLRHAIAFDDAVDNVNVNSTAAPGWGFGFFPGFFPPKPESPEGLEALENLGKVTQQISDFTSRHLPNRKYHSMLNVLNIRFAVSYARLLSPTHQESISGLHNIRSKGELDTISKDWWNTRVHRHWRVEGDMIWHKPIDSESDYVSCLCVSGTLRLDCEVVSLPQSFAFVKAGHLDLRGISPIVTMPEYFEHVLAIVLWPERKRRRFI